MLVSRQRNSKTLLDATNVDADRLGFGGRGRPVSTNRSAVAIHPMLQLPILRSVRRVTKPVLARKLFSPKGLPRSRGSDLSGLAKIEEILDHPVDLFRIWLDEARKYKSRTPDACCLATVSKDCRVSARNVILREFDGNGFVIVTDRRSRKSDNLENVPGAAMCYLWCYVNEGGQNVVRQVRVEGIVRRLEKEEYQPIYDREPLYCKIRSHLCHQGSQVCWEGLKQRHDEILDRVRKNETNLPMPDHYIGYKLFPTMMEFYYATDHLIADRIIYRKKDESDESWEHQRIAA